MDIHHLTYDTLGRETLKDVIVVCRSCHDTLHDDDHVPWRQWKEDEGGGKGSWEAWKELYGSDADYGDYDYSEGEDYYDRQYIYRTVYLKSVHWKDFRDKALRAANWTCQKCGQIDLVEKAAEEMAARLRERLPIREDSPG